MKKIIFILSLFLAAATAPAQTYSIDWFKIAGGGGMQSTGGVYAVSGTVGQHDAGGPMTGGSYALTGGFWNLFAVQTPGGPTLSIQVSGGNAIISWLASSTGFRLQQNAKVNTVNWTGAGNPVNVNGTNQVTISPSPGNHFFRLIYP